MNTAYISAGLVSNSSKKSSEMTWASCISSLSPFLSATKPLNLYLNSVAEFQINQSVTNSVKNECLLDRVALLCSSFLLQEIFEQSIV